MDPYIHQVVCNSMIYQESDEHHIDNHELAHKIIRDMKPALRVYLLLSIDPQYQTGDGRPVHSKIAKKMASMGCKQLATEVRDELESTKAELKARYGSDVV